MFHTPAKLTFGGPEKMFGVQKAPGAPNTYKGAKIEAIFILDRNFLVGAPKISAGGTKW